MPYWLYETKTTGDKIRYLQQASVRLAGGGLIQSAWIEKGSPEDAGWTVSAGEMLATEQSSAVRRVADESDSHEPSFRPAPWSLSLGAPDWRSRSSTADGRRVGLGPFGERRRTREAPPEGGASAVGGGSASTRSSRRDGGGFPHRLLQPTMMGLADQVIPAHSPNQRAFCAFQCHDHPMVYTAHPKPGMNDL